MSSELGDVLVKRPFVNLRLAKVVHLEGWAMLQNNVHHELLVSLIRACPKQGHGLTYVRVPRTRDVDTLAVRNLLVEHNNRSMPANPRSHDVGTSFSPLSHARTSIAYHMPSICMPVNCLDMDLAIPWLRSYTYSFTGAITVIR